MLNFLTHLKAPKHSGKFFVAKFTSLILCIEVLLLTNMKAVACWEAVALLDSAWLAVCWAVAHLLLPIAHQMIARGQAQGSRRFQGRRHLRPLTLVIITFQPLALCIF